MVKFETGDIIFVSGKSLFKNAIAWFETGPGEEKTYAKHIAGMKTNNIVIEALTNVKETNSNNWIQKHKKFEVWRYKKLTEENKVKIFNYLDDKKGSIYGGWKLFFFAGDFLLSKIFRHDNFYLFRRVLFMENFPICSWLYAYAYDIIGYRFDGKNPNSLDPDTMHDIVKVDKNWEMIYKK